MINRAQPMTELESAIDNALSYINGHDPSTDDYAKSVDSIAKLHKMKDADRPDSISPDTILLCATNIAGIIMVIKHEQFNVITTKALGFVLKPR